MNLYKKSTLTLSIIIALQTIHLNAAEQLSIKKSNSDIDWVTDFSDSSPKSTHTAKSRSNSPEQLIAPESDSNSIVLECKDYIELCKLDDRLRTDVILTFKDVPSANTSTEDLNLASQQKAYLNEESMLKIISILSENKYLYGSFAYAWKKKILYDEKSFDENSESPIIRLYKKNKKIMKPVLLNYIDRYEDTETGCLLEGIEFRRIEALQFLIDLGVNINKQNFFGMTALHVAYLQGSNDIIQLLLASGADNTAKNIIGITPDGNCSIS